MRLTTMEQAAFSAAYGIEMASVEGLEAPTASIALGRVAVGGETAAHKHDEAEAFIVLRGRGDVIVDGVGHPVAAGSVAVFEPFETHTLRNRGEEPLEFVDLFWRDSDRALRAAPKTGAERYAGRPVFVFSTPPTPNGDLHLGHLSGPYLGADVFVRFQRMMGTEAYHLTGSDDFQSYVVGRARVEGRTPAEVAAHFAAEIRETLSLADIAVDQFTVTGTDPAYREGLREFFSRIAASGSLARRADPGLFDDRTGAYLYEVDVSGGCPSCGAPTGGNICEECGEPNLCVDLDAPNSRLSEAPPRTAPAERYSLPVHAFADRVAEHQARGKVSPRLQDLAARVFARSTFHLPVTHPSEWGVPPAEEGADGQVIWVWPEMAYGFLHGIAALGARLGRDWQANAPRDDWKIVHFFGYDNSFYHTILFPILYELAHPTWDTDIEYNVNEFYLLEGKKFSTSRRHAIWGKEILTPETVDQVRYYLALTRGEVERTNFERKAFDRTVAETLVGRWQGWLAALGQRVEVDFDGRAPDAGSWTSDQRAFLARLQARVSAAAVHYGADGFSLNAAMETLNGLVEDAARFAQAQLLLRMLPAERSAWRTATALELAAARTLAQLAAPAMPRFASRLGDAVGCPAALHRWSDQVGFVPAGTPISLATTRFFTPPAAGAANGHAGIEPEAVAMAGR